MAATATENLPVIAPADAFRALLRARYPTRPELAQEIDGYSWFHVWDRIDSPDDLAARQALKELKDKFHAGAIGARGTLDRAQAPAEIDPSERATGELDIFEKTLDCDGGRRIYRNVYLLRRDVDCLIQPAGGKSEAGRKGGAPQALDWSALDAAIRGEVKKHGLPNPKNPPGWWYQADVERFAAEFIESLGDSASESTIRDHVRETLKNIEAGN